MPPSKRPTKTARKTAPKTARKGGARARASYVEAHELRSFLPDDRAWWAYSYGTPDDPEGPQYHIHLLEQMGGRLTGSRSGRPYAYVEFKVVPHLPMFTGKLSPAIPGTEGNRLKMPWGEYLKLVAVRKECPTPEAATRYARINWRSFTVSHVKNAQRKPPL